MPWQKRELFKTDIKEISINLDENWSIRNKWNKNSSNGESQSGTHQKITDYQDRNLFPFKECHNNDKAKAVTYNYYKRSMISQLLSKEISNDYFIELLKMFEASKFSKSRKIIPWNQLPMIEFYKNYELADDKDKNGRKIKAWKPVQQGKDKTVVIC